MLLRGCAQTRSPLNFLPAYGRAPETRGPSSADAAVSYSSAVAEHLRRNAVPRVHVVPLFAPHVEPSPDPGEPSLLFVGRVTPVKGILPLLEALARIEGQLEICGTGWGLDAAQSATERLGLQSRVTFSGWVGPQALDAAYRRARIVVVPSLWPEPFGLVGIEAMAHRRPVVGYATGGIPDWLVHGRTGLLVAPGDVPGLAAAMCTLLQDPALCARMGLAGQAHAMARFSEAEHVQGLSSTYAAAHDHWRHTGGSK